jgi:predicted regulator of Ras-like GTPase activity (Roadblock/LC7/MglB family)
VPFRTILRELVRAVDGAEGAIVVDAEGEAVRWFPENTSDRLLLRAAYVALSAESCRASLEKLRLKKTEPIVLGYQGASFVADDLGGGYSLILELNASANLAQAMDKIKDSAKILREEIM